jgi:hypothetical protein
VIELFVLEERVRSIEQRVMVLEERVFPPPTPEEIHEDQTKYNRYDLMLAGLLIGKLQASSFGADQIAGEVMVILKRPIGAKNAFHPLTHEENSFLVMLLHALRDSGVPEEVISGNFYEVARFAASQRV